MKAAAVDKMLCPIIAEGSLQRDLAAPFKNADDFMRGADGAARYVDLRGVSCRDFPVIDDSGLRDVQSFDTVGVGLELFKPLRADHFDALKLIGDTAAIQLF